MLRLALLHYNGYFTPATSTYTSVNTELLRRLLSRAGKQALTVELLSYDRLQEIGGAEYDYLIVGSSQNREVKKYIEDLIVAYRGVHRFVPHPDAILAHENKGYQALQAALLGIPYVKTRYYCGAPSSKQYMRQTVLKDTSGAGSKTVTLARSEKDWSGFGKRRPLLNITPRELLLVVRAYIRKLTSKGSAAEISYYWPNRRYVAQSFVPNLSYDYKVVVFWERVFVLKRWVRPKDFRASGSGDFEFVEVPDDLLEFALHARQVLDVPYVSLDVVDGPERYQIIEYQCAHFGTYTLTSAPFAYQRDAGKRWHKADNTFSVEEAIAQSLLSYLESKREMNSSGVRDGDSS